MPALALQDLRCEPAFTVVQSADFERCVLLQSRLWAQRTALGLCPWNLLPSPHTPGLHTPAELPFLDRHSQGVT